MDGPGHGWEQDLDCWLKPFLDGLSRQAQRSWAPVYLKGLLLPGERKSVEPMAARVAPGDTQQLHHFVSTSPWATAPLEDELVKAADRLVGSPDAVLVVDDTALVKQGRRSVGVKRQCCGQLGKKVNWRSAGSRSSAPSRRRPGTGSATRRRPGRRCRLSRQVRVAAPARYPPSPFSTPKQRWTSLRMAAPEADILHFPASSRRSYWALRSGFRRMPTTAAM
jgi:hypothetical protein